MNERALPTCTVRFEELQVLFNRTDLSCCRPSGGHVSQRLLHRPGGDRVQNRTGQEHGDRGYVALLRHLFIRVIHIHFDVLLWFKGINEKNMKKKYWWKIFNISDLQYVQ